ncbi:hypothetical protein ACFLZN_00885 [Nanoarchaeota archaeon]
MENVPIFVKVDDYKDIVDILALTREKVSQAKHILSKINELKGKEDEIISGWESKISDVEQNVNEIDDSLSKRAND